MLQFPTCFPEAEGQWTDQFEKKRAMIESDVRYGIEKAVYFGRHIARQKQALEQLRLKLYEDYGTVPIRTPDDGKEEGGRIRNSKTTEAAMVLSKMTEDSNRRLKARLRAARLTEKRIEKN